MGVGFEEGGLAEGEVKKCPVDNCLAHGRILRFQDAFRWNVDGNRIVFAPKSGGSFSTNEIPCGICEIRLRSGFLIQRHNCILNRDWIHDIILYGNRNFIATFYF